VPEIIVSRPEEGWDKGLARLVSYKIVVDEAPIAALRRGDQASVAVAAGRHTVRAEIDRWCGSERVDLDLGERDRAYMRCERSFRTSLIPKMLLYQTIWRRRFLDLQLLRVEPLN
jgi:hypothetical protein